MATEDKKDQGGKRTFEEALERLEAIAQAMETGNLGLEKMVEAYEEGQALIKECSSKLNEVEKRIELLVKKEDGEDGVAPFEEG